MDDRTNSSDLINQRDGCLICMDYSDYNKEYPYLVTHFKSIARVLKEELIYLREKGCRLQDSYSFGFSYGARLIVRAGDEVGSKQLGIIHRSYKI